MQAIIAPMSERNLDKAALRGEPSYVWRAGQQRRLEMIVRAAGERIKGCILEDGCGVGTYVEHLSPFGGQSSAWNTTLSARRSSNELPAYHQRGLRNTPAACLDL